MHADFDSVQPYCGNAIRCQTVRLSVPRLKIDILYLALSPVIERQFAWSTAPSPEEFINLLRGESYKAANPEMRGLAWMDPVVND